MSSQFQARLVSFQQSLYTDLPEAIVFLGEEIHFLYPLSVLFGNLQMKLIKQINGKGTHYYKYLSAWEFTKKEVKIKVTLRIWDLLFLQRKWSWDPRELKPRGNILGNKQKIMIILGRSVYANSSQYRLFISGIRVTLLFLVQGGEDLHKRKFKLCFRQLKGEHRTLSVDYQLPSD